MASHIHTSPDPATAPVGATLNDTATVAPGGRIDFYLFGPGDDLCATVIFTNSVTASLAGTYSTSAGYTTTAPGTYHWIATLRPSDFRFEDSQTSCADEPVTVTKASTGLSTTPQPRTATVGMTLNDDATLTGGVSPTGTLTISLFAPFTGCTGTAAYTDVITVNGAGTYHTATQGTNAGGFVANAVGVWAWTAVYSGDANNFGSSTSCGGELVTVTQATTTLNTAPQPASATVGTTLNDDASLSGGFGTLSGTLTISLFPPSSPACTTPVYTDVIPVSGVGTYHTQTQGTLPGGSAANTVGTWQWTAVYSGDANNAGSSSGCGSEPVAVAQAHPTLTTAPDPSNATAGTALKDKATLAGGASPAGTITFTLYAPADRACAGAAIFTDPVLVSSGNGTYSTSVGYPALAAGTYHWRASYSGDPNNASASSACATEPVVVSAGPPATLVLTPPGATNTVGQQHCVTATVKDAFGNPVSGVSVEFSIGPSVPTTFPNPSGGTDTTDANGQATFCYRAALPGVDAIHAFADTSNNGAENAGEPSDEATKTWTPPASTQLCEVTITDGGWIIADNRDRANFGGNAKVLPDGTLQGQQEYQDKGPAQPMNVHSTQITATTCSSDRKSASIFGKATIDGSGTHVFRIDVTDMGSGGSNDSYGIMLDTGYMSGQHALGGGNITIH